MDFHTRGHFSLSKGKIISLLMLSFCAEGVRGSTSAPKHACIKGSIILFDKDLISVTGTDASLYHIKSGMLIATWNLTHFLFEKIRGKVFRDGTGNLWIGNIDQEDKGIYEVKHGRDGKILNIYNQELTVLVPPTTNCYPKITPTNVTLVASVESTECGVPEPSVYFVQYQHISYIGKTIARLTPGKEGGTYAACLETPALICVTSFKPSDFCRYFTIPESSNQAKSSDTMSDIRVVVILSLILVLLWFPVMAVYIEMRIIRLTALRSNHVYQDLPKLSKHQTSQQMYQKSQETEELQAEQQHQASKVSSQNKCLKINSSQVNSLTCKKYSSKEKLSGSFKLIGE